MITLPDLKRLVGPDPVKGGSGDKTCCELPQPRIMAGLLAYDSSMLAVVSSLVTLIRVGAALTKERIPMSCS